MSSLSAFFMFWFGFVTMGVNNAFGDHGDFTITDSIVLAALGIMGAILKLQETIKENKDE